MDSPMEEKISQTESEEEVESTSEEDSLVEHCYSSSTEGSEESLSDGSASNVEEALQELHLRDLDQFGNIHERFLGMARNMNQQAQPGYIGNLENLDMDYFCNRFMDLVENMGKGPEERENIGNIEPLDENGNDRIIEMILEKINGLEKQCDQMFEELEDFERRFGHN